MFSRSSANIARHKNNNFIIDHEAAHTDATLQAFFFFFHGSIFPSVELLTKRPDCNLMSAALEVNSVCLILPLI